MKKIVKVTTCLFLSGLSLQTFAQANTGQMFTINGNIKGIDSGKIYVRSLDQKVIDSAVIAKGCFVLQGKFEEPGRRIFQVTPGNWMFPAFVDAAQITINIDTAGAMHQYSGGKDYPIITAIKETGSPLADAYALYKRETGQDEYLMLAGKVKSVSKDSAAIITRQMDAIRDAFPGKGKAWTDKYITQNPASFPAVFIFQEYFHESHDKSAGYLRSVMSQFSGPAKESAPYQALNKELLALENVQAGKLAPDFTLQKRDKSKLTLSSTRGTVVMLDFWASWCIPCRAGIPDWKKVYAKYHAKGFNIISIADDRKWGEWVKAMDKEKMPWAQVVDSFPNKNLPAVVGELYGIRYIPHFVLIGKEGKIIAASGDAEVIKNKLKEMFE